MRLYFKPGACSLAPRIVLAELGIDHESIAVDTAAGTAANGENYRTINPKGYVPALRLDDGAILTENPAILQYLADRCGRDGFAPTHGTLERARLHEWLNFTSAELHKAFAPFFRAVPPDGATREAALDLLAARIGYVEHRLADGRAFALSGGFSVADAYLFVVLSWTRHIAVDLARWPHVAAYVARIAERPAVRASFAAEGLEPMA
jgi:glutathione S-transferase